MHADGYGDCMVDIAELFEIGVAIVRAIVTDYGTKVKPLIAKGYWDGIDNGI